MILVVSICLKTSLWEKLRSDTVLSKMWPFQFSLQLEYSFGKISSPGIESFTFLCWSEWKKEKDDSARPRKPKLEILGDCWLNQTWYISQKYKTSKYKNPKHTFSYLKNGVSFIVSLKFARVNYCRTIFITIRKCLVKIIKNFQQQTWNVTAEDRLFVRVIPRNVT